MNYRAVARWFYPDMRIEQDATYKGVVKDVVTHILNGVSDIEARSALALRPLIQMFFSAIAIGLGGVVLGGWKMIRR